MKYRYAIDGEVEVERFNGPDAPIPKWATRCTPTLDSEGVWFLWFGGDDTLRHRVSIGDWIVTWKGVPLRYSDEEFRLWYRADRREADALRLADAAVIAAANAMLEPDATEAWIGWRSNFPKLAKDLGLAVLARRKALAEQAKERAS